MRAEQVPTLPEEPTTAPRSAVTPLLVGALVGVLATILLGAVMVGPLVVAKRNDLPLERVYGDFAVSVASRVGGGTQQNPVAQNPRAVAAGRDAYTGSCSVCHGATGDGRGAFGQSSYPNATDLTSHDTLEKSDGQMFWIVKNGLSFSGMPGFADQYSDQDIWSIVTYVRALQDPGSAPTGRNAQVRFGPIVVPTPTSEQLDRADPSSADAAARGAAVYFAQGCQTCHGPVGDAPGNLALGRGGGFEGVRAIRQGRPGMPSYSPALVNDRELADLQAYLATIGSTRRGGEGDGD